MNLKNTLAVVVLSTLVFGCAKDQDHEPSRLVIEVLTDRSADEISWTLFNVDAEVIRKSGSYDNETYYEIPLDLQPHSYRFVLEDTGKDGICCTNGAGRVSLKLDGELIANIEEYDENGERFVEEYIKHFDVAGYSGHTAQNLRPEYQSAEGLRGFELKTELHNITKASHSIQSTGGINDFIERDKALACALKCHA